MTVLDFTSARQARLLTELDEVLLEHPDIRLDGEALVLAIDELCLTQCNQHVTYNNMAKQRTDRSNTTQRGTGYVAMRLSPNEVQALGTLVDIEQAAIDEAGQVHRASQSSVLRALLRREAVALGVWQSSSAPTVDPRQLTIDDRISSATPTPQAQTEHKVAAIAAEKRAVEVTEDTIRCCEDQRMGLTFVPTLVAALGGDVEQVHAALDAGARAGRWELRPESGMGRLSAEERALCIKIDDRLLSWVRLPGPEPASELDAGALAARCRAHREANALSQGKLAAAVTETTGAHIRQGEISTLESGARKLSQAKQQVIHAYLTSKGA